ncbi:MAG: ribonuclease P protein component [Deltaproteobacteria bacterium]|nr:ribonuclease P protein component [Deltaproteobacteria bacterium]
MKPEGFPGRLRLRRRREFLRVQRGGVKHHTRFFLVFVARQRRRGRGSRPVVDGAPQLPDTRLGVTVTRKVGSAVKRNRIKRLVREAFRRERNALPLGFDMVWVAKREAVETTLPAVLHDMKTLATRLHDARDRRSS